MKVFQMDEETWWIAESLDSAIADYVSETGEQPDEPYELSDEQLDSTMMMESEASTPCTFRIAIENHIKEGHSIPGFFAGTEW